MKLKIENPHRLIEMYKEIAPNWVMKFRGSSEDVYKFGLQSNKSLVWDEFQVFIGKEMKVLWDTHNFTPHYYVVLAMNSTSSVKNEITNQISLEEVKNPQKLIEHILDGIDEIISK
jgi:hypothetical protein